MSSEKKSFVPNVQAKNEKEMARCVGWPRVWTRWRVSVQVRSVRVKAV